MNQASAVSAPSAAAARMRKSREHRRQGDVIVSLRVGSSEISDLAALGWMPATARDDKDTICLALIELIEQAIALRVTPSTTPSEGTRLAPLRATAGPSVTQFDENARLPPRVETSAEPGEVLGSKEGATEIVRGPAARAPATDRAGAAVRAGPGGGVGAATGFVPATENVDAGLGTTAWSGGVCGARVAAR